MGLEGTARPGGGQGARRPSPRAVPAVNWSIMLRTIAGCSSPSPAPPAGACWPSTAARPSAPPGSSSPPSAPTCVGYRFYSRFLADRVFGLNDRRATPAERLANGRDYVPTTRWVLFGHHFAAIAGAGPLVGPVLAAQFGYLPGTIWIVFGVVLAGAVQDFVILFASMRRDGKSLGQMAKEETGPVTGLLAMVAVLAIMVILLAVLALVVVNALKDSPWGVFTIALHHSDRAADGLLDEGVAAGRGRSRPPPSAWCC